MIKSNGITGAKPWRRLYPSRIWSHDNP